MSRALRVVDADAERRAIENRQARERAATEAELATARAQLSAEARAVASAEQRDADTREMNAAIKFVQSLPARLWPELRALVELDRQASDIVDRIADLVVDGLETFERATELADHLEQPHVVQRTIRAPSLAWASLLGRVAIKRDRAHGGRDLRDGWVEAAVEPARTSLERPAFDQAVALVTSMEKNHG